MFGTGTILPTGTEGREGFKGPTRRRRIPPRPLRGRPSRTGRSGSCFGPFSGTLPPRRSPPARTHSVPRDHRSQRIRVFIPTRTLPHVLLPGMTGPFLWLCGPKGLYSTRRPGPDQTCGPPRQVVFQDDRRDTPGGKEGKKDGPRSETLGSRLHTLFLE